MATVTLKYTKLNSSLSVGDYVFYMTPSTSGSYTVEDSFGGRYLGRVQSIAPPTNPPLVIQNVDMPFKNKRTSPNTGSLSALFNLNTYGNNKFLVSKTLNPDFLNQVYKTRVFRLFNPILPKRKPMNMQMDNLK